MTPRVIHKNDIMSPFGVLSRGVLLGVISSLTTTTLFLIVAFAFSHPVLKSFSPMLVPILVAAFVFPFFGIPFNALRGGYFHIDRRRYIIVASLIYTGSFFTLPAFGYFVYTSFYAGSPTILILVICGIGAWCPIAACVGVSYWRHLRRTYPVVIVHDTPLCLACGYNLIGNVSLVCPECGRPFTFGELGMTAEEFRQQQVLTKAVARADNARVEPLRE